MMLKCITSQGHNDVQMLYKGQGQNDVQQKTSQGHNNGNLKV